MTAATAITFEVPLPPRELSSNGSHGHWSRKSRAAKQYRLACRFGALAATQCATAPEIVRCERVRVSYLFGIKDARKLGLYCPRDVSNAIAAFKAGQDGIVDAGLIRDDSARYMELGTVTIDPKVGPFVRVTVEVCG